jgi:hypothetical protein
MIVQIAGQKENPDNDKDDEKGNLGLQPYLGNPVVEQGPDPRSGKKGDGSGLVCFHRYQGERGILGLALLRSIALTKITPISNSKYIGTPIKLILKTSGVGVTTAAIIAMRRIAYFRFRVKKAAFTTLR